MMHGFKGAMLKWYAVLDTRVLRLSQGADCHLVWRLQPGGRGISRMPEVVACQVLHDRLQSAAHHRWRPTSTAAGCWLTGRSHTEEKINTTMSRPAPVHPVP